MTDFPPTPPERFLMGNAAIGRGAVKAGVTLACGYPGTPSSEILSAVAAASDPARVHVEWSVNEKAAMEVAAGAAYAGARTLVTMKMVGLNVASDPLASLAYVGVKGALVVVSADDPGPISSQTEQDSRAFGDFVRIPVFDPATPEEAYEMIQDAFACSQKWQTPVLFRPTTRVCHAYAAIPDEPLPPPPPAEGFRKDPLRWVIFPKFSRLAHEKIERRNPEIGKAFSAYRFQSVEGSGKKAVFAGGVSWAYAKDFLSSRPASAEPVRLVRIATPHPFPDDFALSVLRDADEVLAFEELSPYIERELLRLAGQHHLPVRIRGKFTGEGILAGENGIDTARTFIGAFLGSPPAAPAAEAPPAPAAEDDPALARGTFVEGAWNDDGYVEAAKRFNAALARYLAATNQPEDNPVGREIASEARKAAATLETRLADCPEGVPLLDYLTACYQLARDGGRMALSRREKAFLADKAKKSRDEAKAPWPVPEKGADPLAGGAFMDLGYAWEILFAPDDAREATDFVMLLIDHVRADCSTRADPERMIYLGVKWLSPRREVLRALRCPDVPVREPAPSRIFPYGGVFATRFPLPDGTPLGTLRVGPDRSIRYKEAILLTDARDRAIGLELLDESPSGETVAPTSAFTPQYLTEDFVTGATVPEDGSRLVCWTVRPNERLLRLDEETMDADTFKPVRRSSLILPRGFADAIAYHVMGR